MSPNYRGALQNVFNSKKFDYLKRSVTGRRDTSFLRLLIRERPFRNRTYQLFDASWRAASNSRLGLSVFGQSFCSFVARLMFAKGERIRPVRSFVLRSGRITKAQEKALNDYWSIWGLEVTKEPLSFNTIFGRDSETILEIGFGMGDSLIQLASDKPDINFVGIEVHSPGIGKLLNAIAKRGLKNIRVVWHDALEVLEYCIPPHSIQGVNIFFPDPWHKKKHQKRRLVNTEFVDLISRRISIGGKIHLATDCSGYAEQMMNIFSGAEIWYNPYGAKNFASRNHGRPETKFELRGKGLGHNIWDLILIRN